MRRPRLLLLLGAVALVGAGSARAAEVHLYESALRIPQPVATAGDPGQALFQSRERGLASIASLCIHTWFDASDPLDPGDELRFTPNSWFDTDPFAAGPGYTNTGTTPQYFRTICVVQFPGLPVDRFLAGFVDGREVFKLVAAVGSVRVARIDVEILGTTG